MSAQSASSNGVLEHPQRSSKGPKAKKMVGLKKVLKPVKLGKPSPSAKAAGTTGKSSSSELVRTSQVLLDILDQNPKVKSFSVDQIVGSIGSTSFGTGLMVFAIPEVLPIPIPGMSAVVVLPTCVLSGQMIMGKRQITLPQYILKRKVPRKALAAAIHAILPALKKAEKVTKPRWKWASSPLAQRLLGLFVFILALSIAVPIPGFNMPQAIAIFIIGLGLVEKDGLMICLGVLLGVASLMLLGAVLFGISTFLGFGGPAPV